MLHFPLFTFLLCNIFCASVLIFFRSFLSNYVKPNWKFYGFNLSQEALLWIVNIIIGIQFFFVKEVIKRLIYVVSTIFCIFLGIQNIICLALIYLLNMSWTFAEFYLLNIIFFSNFLLFQC